VGYGGGDKNPQKGQLYNEVGVGCCLSKQRREEKKEYPQHTKRC